MKKYLLLIILMIEVGFYSLFAQEEKEYIIDRLHFCNSADLVLGTLRNNGWIEGELTDEYNFEGEIYGYKNCLLSVRTIGSRAVGINIFFPECYSWGSLDSVYHDISRKVYYECEKEPKIEENFTSNFSFISDEHKLEMLKQDSCEFSRDYDGILVEKIYDKEKGFRVVVGCSFGFTVTIGDNSWQEYFHQKFLGIPLMGDTKAFISKLREKGFTEGQKTKENYCFEGKFAGIKKCNILVPNRPNMYAVTVLLPPKKSWTELYGDYCMLKDKLSNKYGPSTYVTETFDGGDFSLSNSEKMSKLINGNCRYTAQFDTTVGIIFLKIEPYMVTLSYIDYKGLSESKKEGIEDL